MKFNDMDIEQIKILVKRECEDLDKTVNLLNIILNLIF